MKNFGTGGNGPTGSDSGLNGPSGDKVVLPFGSSNNSFARKSRPCPHLVIRYESYRMSDTCGNNSKFVSMTDEKAKY